MLFNKTYHYLLKSVHGCQIVVIDNIRRDPNVGYPPTSLTNNHNYCHYSNGKEHCCNHRDSLRNSTFFFPPRKDHYYCIYYYNCCYNCYYNYYSNYSHNYFYSPENNSYKAPHIF
nr:MAG TPA: hypothetical protein [Caudoviricetes sp.]